MVRRVVRRMMMVHRLHFLAVGDSARVFAETFATNRAALLIVEEIADLITLENFRRYHLRMNVTLFIAEHETIDTIHSRRVGEGRWL